MVKVAKVTAEAIGTFQSPRLRVSARGHFRLAALSLALAVAIGLGLASRAHAARGAKVDLPDVPMYKGPGKKYAEVMRLKKGTRLHASNYPTEGFYKVRTGAGQIGWVKAETLLLDPMPERGSEPPPPPPDSGDAKPDEPQLAVPNDDSDSDSVPASR